MSSDGDGVTRRYMLQTLGATGAAAVAGCMGGGGDEPDSEETPVDEEEDSTPVQTTEEPDYELPESEHVDTADFFKEWMLLPPGDEFAAASYSPSKLNEQYDTTLLSVIGQEHNYDIFDFSEADIPEAFVEEDQGDYKPTLKVDQLPGGVSEEDVIQQLQDAGYSKDRQIGGFEVYTGEGEPRAVGKGRHILGWVSGSAPNQAIHNYMNSVLEQETEDQLKPGPETKAVVDALNIQDSLTIQKGIGTSMPINRNYQPELGATSVNFEEGTKYGAWVFEDEETAETAYSMLEPDDSFSNFENIERNGRFITASEGDYSTGELNANPLQLSVPRV